MSKTFRRISERFLFQHSYDLLFGGFMKTESLQQACFILFLATGLFSCTVTRTQQAELFWNQPDPANNITYMTPDSSLKFEYDTWNNGGKVQTVITNFSDSILIIDLKTSRFEVNGLSRAYGYPDWQYQESQFDMTAGDVNDYLTINPGSSRRIELFTLNAYINLNYDKPKVRKDDSLTYNVENSPLKVTNHVIYALGYNDWTAADHSFYLNKLYGWKKGNAQKPVAGSDKSRFYVRDQRASGGVLAAVSLSLILIFLISGG